MPTNPVFQLRPEGATGHAPSEPFVSREQPIQSEECYPCPPGTTCAEDGTSVADICPPGGLLDLMFGVSYGQSTSFSDCDLRSCYTRVAQGAEKIYTITNSMSNTLYRCSKTRRSLNNCLRRTPCRRNGATKEQASLGKDFPGPVVVGRSVRSEGSSLIPLELFLHHHKWYMAALL